MRAVVVRSEDEPTPHFEGKLVEMRAAFVLRASFCDILCRHRGYELPEDKSQAKST